MVGGPLMIHDILRRNNVSVQGTGSQPMMFAHGFGCDQSTWQSIAPSFYDQYRVILFDHIGAGGSDYAAYRADRYGDLQAYAQDVIDICLALNLSRLIFIGHSISGMIGVLASLRAPERFEQLILIGSSPHYINEPPDYVGGFERADIVGLLDLMEKNFNDWASFLAPRAMQNTDRPELARNLEGSFRSGDPMTLRQFAEATFFTDNRQDLPLVTVPSLILQASDDMIVPQEVSNYLHRYLPASTLRRMQATGHYPHLSAPDETLRLIREYLA
jgi:sigma-B regulation protein RsbQ